MNEKKLAEKTLTANMIDVNIQLYEPFYNFLKEYLAFFGSKQTIEDVCRSMIYDSVKLLHANLKDFAYGDFRYIENGAWFTKWPHLGCVAFDAQDEEEETGEK